MQPAGKTVVYFVNVIKWFSVGQILECAEQFDCENYQLICIYFEQSQCLSFFCRWIHLLATKKWLIRHPDIPPCSRSQRTVMWCRQLATQTARTQGKPFGSSLSWTSIKYKQIFLKAICLQCKNSKQFWRRELLRCLGNSFCCSLYQLLNQTLPPLLIKKRKLLLHICFSTTLGAHFSASHSYHSVNTPEHRGR